jgi:hypothetical protein
MSSKLGEWKIITISKTYARAFDFQIKICKKLDFDDIPDILREFLIIIIIIVGLKILDFFLTNKIFFWIGLGICLFGFGGIILSHTHASLCEF